MKKNTIKGKTVKDLKEMLDDKTKKLNDFKQSVVMGRTKNVKEGRELRKEIARILTSLNSNKEEVNA
jgi:ribosomal protein L29